LPTVNAPNGSNRVNLGSCRRTMARRSSSPDHARHFGRIQTPAVTAVTSRRNSRRLKRLMTDHRMPSQAPASSRMRLTRGRIGSCPLFPWWGRSGPGLTNFRGCRRRPVLQAPPRAGAGRSARTGGWSPCRRRENCTLSEGFRRGHAPPPSALRHSPPRRWRAGPTPLCRPTVRKLPHRAAAGIVISPGPHRGSADLHVAGPARCKSRRRLVPAPGPGFLRTIAAIRANTYDAAHE